MQLFTSIPHALKQFCQPSCAYYTTFYSGGFGSVPGEGESGIGKGVEESADQNGDRTSDRELQ